MHDTDTTASGDGAADRQAPSAERLGAHWMRVGRALIANIMRGAATGAGTAAGTWLVWWLGRR